MSGRFPPVFTGVRQVLHGLPLRHSAGIQEVFPGKAGAEHLSRSWFKLYASSPVGEPSLFYQDPAGFPAIPGVAEL